MPCYRRDYFYWGRSNGIFKLMLETLRTDKDKIPSPSKDDMMKMLSQSWNVASDIINALLTNAELGGSKDYLVKITL